MQTIEFGEGKISSLKFFLEKENPRKILLLRGNKSFHPLLDIIDDLVSCQYVSFVLSESHISFNTLSKGLKFYNSNQCDHILCIGGGTVIDFGKLISIFSVNNSPVSDYTNGIYDLVPKKNKLFVMPTTSGSGSEATQFAVLYNGLKKYSISHPSLLPDYVVIDPELTYTLSPYQTAVSGMDALCQGIESFWSLSSTEDSRNYSAKAIGLVLDNIEESVINPSKKSRHFMSQGSHYAGKAINIAKTTAAHAFSYPLTRLFDIPHGHAVSLTIGDFYVLNCEEHRLNKTVNSDTIDRDLFHELNKLLYVKNCEEARDKLKSLMKNIGLFTELSSRVDFKTNVFEVTNNVNLDRLSNNPVSVSKSHLRMIFQNLCS